MFTASLWIRINPLPENYQTWNTGGFKHLCRTMPSVEKKKFLWLLLFIAWMGVLCKFILFKHPPGYYHSPKFLQYTLAIGLDRANFIPFQGIRDVMIHPGYYDYFISNIYGNIVGFIPVGFLLPMISGQQQKFRKLLLTLFLISFCFEVIQFFTALGVFDVDDLILNTAGGVCGFICFRLLEFFSRKNLSGSR
jgi:glycopeptide antibiotics resistance protein